jgi:hypothetical protein
MALWVEKATIQLNAIEPPKEDEMVILVRALLIVQTLPYHLRPYFLPGKDLLMSLSRGSMELPPGDWKL